MHEEFVAAINAALASSRPFAATSSAPFPAPWFRDRCPRKILVGLRFVCSGAAITAETTSIRNQLQVEFLRWSTSSDIFDVYFETDFFPVGRIGFWFYEM